MRKPLALFLVLLVFVSGGLAAAAVLPHAHGNDLNHSQHQTCPVYQLSLHGFNAVVVFFSAVAGLAVFFYLALQKIISPASFAGLSFSSRAPPVLT